MGRFRLVDEGYFIPGDGALNGDLVTAEYDCADKARERAERIIEREAVSDELRKVWRKQAQIAGCD